MSKILYLILLCTSLFSQTLSTLYREIASSDLYKQAVYEIEARYQSQKELSYDDNWEVGGNVAYANLKDNSDSGTEFQVTLGKNIMLNVSKIDRFLQANQSYSQTLKEIKLNQLKARLFQLYGNYCITMDALQAKAELAVAYERIQEQIDKGVEFGEFDISKSIITHMSLENLNLEISKMEADISNYEAQLKSISSFDGIYECKNLKPNFTAMFSADSSLYFRLLNDKRVSSQADYTLASSTVPTLNLAGSYTDEIDTQRYTVNLSVPFTFGSKKYEAKKSAALANMSATNYQLKAFANRYLQESQALKRQLDIYNKYVKQSEISIKTSAEKLIQQSNQRFLAGEESLLGVLKATETKLQMIQNILELKLQRHNRVSEYLYTYAIDPQGVTQ